MITKRENCLFLLFFGEKKFQLTKTFSEQEIVSYIFNVDKFQIII